MATSPVNAVIAAHRFGLGEPNLRVVGNDPAAWLRAQIGPADQAQGEDLLTSMDAMRAYADQKSPITRALVGPQRDKPNKKMKKGMKDEDMKAEAMLPTGAKDLIGADVQSRLMTAANTKRPFAERLALFWANHFSVSVAKGAVRGLAGPLEREAIRPNIAGKFETLLRASSLHAAMLRYLDNNNSIGPDSNLGMRTKRKMEEDGPDMRPRVTGLNENLAREILELHTLGVADGGGVYGPWGGYTQADVTAFAAVLTGWRAAAGPEGSAPVTFDPQRHEPGPKKIMGKTYPEGPQAVDMVLRDVALHPNTARHLATKLARHFVADQPPKPLVDKLAQSYLSSGGDLPTMYRTLIDADEAWGAAPVKLKTPEEFAISSLRVLGVKHAGTFKDPGVGVGTMGQRPQAAPSPAGWPDVAEEWLGPEALWKRIEWSMRLAKELPPNEVDARAVARDSLGPRLTDSTAQQIDRASDGQQAVVLLLLSPEFQRR